MQYGVNPTSQAQAQAQAKKFWIIASHQYHPFSGHGDIYQPFWIYLFHLALVITVGNCQRIKRCTIFFADVFSLFKIYFFVEYC